MENDSSHSALSGQSKCPDGRDRPEAYNLNTECTIETQETMDNLMHQYCQHNQPKLVTSSASAIQATALASPTNVTAAADAENGRRPSTDHDPNMEDEDSGQNRRNFDQVEKNGSSNHSIAAPNEMPHVRSQKSCHQSKLETASKTKSKQVFNSRLRVSLRDNQGSGTRISTAIAKGQNLNEIFAEPLVSSTRTRTVTTFRRFGPELSGLPCASASSSEHKGGMTTSVIIDRKKSPSDFVHRVTVEVLPNILTTKENIRKSTEDVVTGSSVADATEYQATYVSDKKDVMRKLEVNSPVDSLNEQRRSRSLLRTKQRRRSRAKSPGPRRGYEQGNVAMPGSEILEVGSSAREMRWIRRESPSPQPALRKRSLTRNILSRAERESRAQERRHEGDKTGGSMGKHTTNIGLKM